VGQHVEQITRLGFEDALHLRELGMTKAPLRKPLQ
jgi:hypothetical protein